MKVNRLQISVIGFFAAAWVTLVAILLLAPEVYTDTLKLPPGSGPGPGLAFLAVLSLFLVFLAVGIVRRWRWTFWLLLLAFLVGGAARIPFSLLQLGGRLPASGPSWYEGLQAVTGVVQLLFGVAMLAGWRAGGLWATPRRRS